MTELKTLKDLPNVDLLLRDEKNDHMLGKLIQTNILRQEAIKWVKKMEKTIAYYRGDQEPFDAGENMKENLLRYFAEFFNLTEEDLK